jgi:hypothetical protein
METQLSDEIVYARKHYDCDACYWWLRSGYTLDDCENSDQKLIVEAAIADKYKIKPGQAYRKVRGKHDGEFCTYRARPGMDSVIRELNLVDD